jgi:hypothetical protein
LIELDDFSAITQLILSLLAGSGLTSIIIFWYEKRERRREKAIDHFLERVLTKDFFSFQSLLWDFCNLYRVHDKIRKGESGLCILRGSFVNIKNETDWRSNVTGLLLEWPAAHRRLEDTGVVSLAPKKVKTRIANMGPRMRQFKKQIDSGQDVSQMAQELEKELKNLSRDISRIIGTYRL